MKKTALLTLSLLTITFSAQKAMTDDGRIVFLRDNGTWTYDEKSNEQNEAKEKKIPTNRKKFQKSTNATFQIKSKTNNSSAWISPLKWKFNNGKKNHSAEYQFKNREKDIYAMFITEEIQFPITELGKLAVENARNISPEITITKEEFRKVNGKTVLHLEFSGTSSGIDFTYIGYYYSDESGSSQYVVYTSTPLVEKYREDIEEFLNGFEIMEVEK